jgi:hypothetical protein
VVVVMLRPSDWDRSVFSEYFGPDRYGSSAGSIARASPSLCRAFKLARHYGLCLRELRSIIDAIGLECEPAPHDVIVRGARISSLKADAA